MRSSSGRRVLTALVVSISCLAVGFVGPAGAAKAKADQVDRQATLRIGQSVQPTTWDPLKWATVTAGYQFLSYVYDQLIEYSPKLKPQAMLATSWQYGNDGLSMTMKLRTGVKFQDGTAFDASAVKANMDRTLAVPSFKAQMPTLVSTDVVDSSTVKFVFSAATFNFADLLAQDSRISSMVSPKSLNDPGLATKPAGSGPYEMVTSSSSGATFERIDGHWDKTSGLAKRVEVQYIADANARLNAVKSGQLELGYVTLDMADAAKSSGVRLIEFPDTVAVQGLMLNYTRPAVSDPRVRKAISLAFDRNTIAAVAFGGYCKPTQQIFSPFTGGYLPKGDTKKALKPDVAGAKKLLAQANATSVKLSVVVPTGNPSLANAAQLMQQQLGAVGITMDLVQQPSSQATTTFADGQFDGYVTGVTGAAESQALIDANLRARGKGFGVPAYISANADQAARTAPGAQRDQRYQKLNEELMAQPAHVAVCANYAFYGAAKGVVGTENVAYGHVSQGIMESRRVGLAKQK